MRFLKRVIFILKQPFEASPICAGAIFFLRLMREIIPVAKILVMAKLIDNVIAVAAKGETLEITYVSLFFLMIIYEKISSNIEAVLSIKLKNALWKISTLQLVTNWAHTQYQYVESEQYYVLFERIKDRVQDQIYSNFVSIIGSIAIIVNIFAIIRYIFQYSHGAGIGMLLLLSILVATSIRGGKIEYSASVEAKNKQVNANYISSLLTDKNAVYERDLFSFHKEISELWNHFYSLSAKLQLNAEKAFLQQYQTVGMFGTLISAIMILMFSIMLNQGKISYGIFASLAANIVSLTKDLSSSINLQIRNIVKAINYTMDYQKIIALPKDIIAPERMIDFEKIEIRGLKYRYLNGEYVLKGINLDICRGKTYALVGENGAGKTTLIKLLVGLYRNYEGSILIDGKELKEHPEYYKLFGTVFQDYAKYNLSLRDNLLIGRSSPVNDDSYIEEVMKKYGLGYLKQKLQNGLDTVLGKRIQQSEDLSGGEWQKVALARVELSDRPVRIYDEPTSSLDPISESEFYSMLFNNRGDETLFIISHRLGITTIVDRIFLLSGGTVAEEGTSSELLSRDGLYTKMYEEQKAWYML